MGFQILETWLRFKTKALQRPKLGQFFPFLTPSKIWEGIGEIFESEGRTLIGAQGKLFLDFRRVGLFRDVKCNWDRKSKQNFALWSLQNLAERGRNEWVNFTRSA